MLCPKGVKRYLQGAHPDRLLTAFKRDTSVPEGFSPMGYQEAITRVASEIGRIQKTYGNSAMGVLSGASLTVEKAYLMGKFARVCLKTPYIDYNGRLCMVSAGAGNKKAFGIDRAANPWSDIPKAELIWISGANVAECAPITTEYVWQARENGARIIVVDPRITPLARTCDLFLPVKPGRDIALFNGVLHLMIEKGWIDRPFIEQFTVGFDKVAEHVASWNPAKTAEVTGIPERLIRQAAEWWGTAKSSFLMHARGIEHHSHGVQNVLGSINMVLASGRIGREGCGYGTITGQANGQGGREHGQKCDQLPGWRDISNPVDRAHIAKIWGIAEPDMPGPGVDCYEMFRKIDKGEIKGLISLCFNPVVSLPDNNFIARALGKLEFYVAIDFFMNETARHADIVLPGSLQEEDEGVVTQIEGKVIKINKAVDCPGDARQDWRIVQDIAAALDRPGVHVHRAARHLRRTPHRQQGWRRGLLGDHLREDRAAVRRLLAVLQRGSKRQAHRSRGHAAAVRARLVERRGQGCGALLLPGRQGPLQRRSVHAAGGGYGHRVPAHADDGARRQPVPLGHTDPANRPAGGPVPGAADRDAPATGRENGDQGRGLGDGRVPSRRLHAPGDGRDDDPPRHHLHSLPLARPQERQPAHDLGSGPHLQDPRVQGVCGPHSQGRRAAGMGRASGAAAGIRRSEPA
jgi:anaerobic selenocysteine-containing dehydrogenase